MNRKEKENIIQTPEKTFLDPAQVLRQEELTGEEKKKALENWEADEKALLRADDENMSAEEDKATLQAQEMLKKVQAAERKLEQEQGTAH